MHFQYEILKRNLNMTGIPTSCDTAACARPHATDLRQYAFINTSQLMMICCGQALIQPDLLNDVRARLDFLTMVGEAASVSAAVATCPASAAGSCSAAELAAHDIAKCREWGFSWDAAAKTCVSGH